MPTWLEPMAATLTAERFTGPEWTFERKLDGIRLIAFKRGTDVRLLSRNRLPQNHAYPSVAAAVASLPVEEAILDGEATGVWAGGEGGRVTYHIFDVLWIDGRDVTGLTLEARRELLARLPMQAPLARVPELHGDKPWDRACKQGWEGVIAKRRDSVYEHRRAKTWLKMKCEATQELVIGGFTEPRGKRAGLGALLVGYFEGDDFVFAGKVGTGFDTSLLKTLRERLDRIERTKPPFTRGKDIPRKGAHWVRPQVVVQVAFMEWTGHGKMRHPRLLGIRTDKRARDVVREQPG
jgi:bifunctional non-homologous end joining protein LigD